ASLSLGRLHATDDSGCPTIPDLQFRLEPLAFTIRKCIWLHCDGFAVCDHDLRFNFGLSSQPTTNSLSRLDNPENNQSLVRDLRPFKSFRELSASGEFESRKPDLERILGRPRATLCAGARPRLQAFLRVIAWNIERGARFEGIVHQLNTHPVLRYADLLLLNELDIGMARSGNVDVSEELSRAISAHSIFATEYLELTKGTEEEQKLDAENTASLHGNAILTR